MDIEAIASEVVDSMMKIHKKWGPGIFESAYKRALAWELTKRGIAVRSEVLLPLVYEDLVIEDAYKIDTLVADQIVIEHKTVKAIEPIHHAQLMTYLKLSGLTLGFLVNWHSVLLKDGLHRVVLNHSTSFPSARVDVASFNSSRLRGEGV